MKIQADERSLLRSEHERYYPPTVKMQSQTFTSMMQNKTAQEYEMSSRRHVPRLRASQACYNIYPI